MISMICSRNLTDPNAIKGFYHLITHPPSPTPYFLKPHLCIPPPPSFVCLLVCVYLCFLPDAEPSSGALTVAGCLFLTLYATTSLLKSAVTV